MRYILIITLALSFACCKSKEPKGETNKPLSKTDYTNPATDNLPADYTKWKIENGKFYFDGKHKFLKIAKPLLNFSDPKSVENFIESLDILKEKHYTNIEINCYWHHFDTDGDGMPDKSLEPLNKLVNAIYAKGMFPCLSIETYAVGGGGIPEGFWAKYPDAYAINNKGEKVTDTEYGFGSKVVSIFHSGYRAAAHTFIQSLAKGIDTKKILYFETTVEPQYMGAIALCYSNAAKQEYEKWRKENNITDIESEMPKGFPISESFIKNAVWNKFRAQFLAKWVNDDAAAYRAIAGQNAYVAVDYLDANEKEQYLRQGDPLEFLRKLTSANIIQVNWTWYFPDDAPNKKAYERVRKIMSETGRDWAITEHMTFNGSDFVQYSNDKLDKILENTLENGTRFGWEFVTVTPGTKDSFSLYNDDWSPKRVMASVDNYWGYWLHRISEVENKQ